MLVYTKKYGTLFIKMLILNIKGLRSYGTDFFIGVIGMAIKNISNIILLLFLYNLIPEINGWNLYQMMYLYSISTISFSLWRCLFMNTLNISYYVKYGKLDAFLTKPANPLFLIFMEGFDDDAWGDLLVGIILNIYITICLDISLIFIPIVLILSFFTSLIFASTSIIGSIFSLKTVGINDFSDIPYMIYEFIKYPTSIYGKFVQIFFSTLLPISWISYIPASSIIFSKNMLYIFFTIVFSILYFTFAYIIWNDYLKKYTSSGS
ncbi:ABC transporter permease [Enterococcus sp. DIV1420a]|uniref:ABC transporter permease n=1 Tax=Enterococcus sp. DIV1420a TaxID=2774672 RepID=UPI0036D4DA4C